MADETNFQSSSPVPGQPAGQRGVPTTTTPRLWSYVRLRPLRLPNPLLLTVVSYIAIIWIVVGWSGSTVEKTLYDKYIIYWDGAILPVESISSSRVFYRDVLNFTEVEIGSLTPNPEWIKASDLKGLEDSSATESASAFLITPKKYLILQSALEKPTTGTTLIVRVRNGFQKLHDQLAKRTGADIQQVDPGSAIQQVNAGQVSQVFSGSWGRQFVVRDLDHNRIVFHEPARKLFGRVGANK